MSQHARPAIHDSDPINFRDIQFLGFAPGASGVPWWHENKSGCFAGLGPERFRREGLYGESFEKAMEGLEEKVETP